MRTLMRSLFIGLPALVAGALVTALFGDLYIGLLITLGVIGTGLNLTEPRPERGESPTHHR